MKGHRKRTCAECGKPLGGTVGKCYECGGEKPEPSRKERLADAEQWKLWAGVPWDMIAEAHGYNSDDSQGESQQSRGSDTPANEGDN